MLCVCSTPTPGTAGAPGADALCVKVVDMFLDALGAEAGNMAIRYQASGGVYIAGGGIANKLLDRILDGRCAFPSPPFNPLNYIWGWKVRPSLPL